MTVTASVLLIISFLTAIVALLMFIMAESKQLFRFGQDAARTIFAKGEEGLVEEPAALNQKALQEERSRLPGKSDDSLDLGELRSREVADKSSRIPAFFWITSSIIWLVIGSVFGLIAALKFNMPDWLTTHAPLTFGRVRTAHLNLVNYGWVSMAGVGVAIWLIPRLLKTSLVGAGYATIGSVLWNLGLWSGTIAILAGWSDGLEWLEFPWQIDILLALGGGLAAVPLFLTLKERKVTHLYVSVWYLGAALLWFPILFVVANIPNLHTGVQEASMNWWYAHNVLGLWLGPLAIAAAYYFIPKTLGRPIYSYNISLVGFWGTALFYSHAGMHHLIGGPIPTWLITISIVHSVMMILPVIAVAINQHMTVYGNFRSLKYSPTLRFIVLGVMMNTLVSLQGSLEATRFFNQIVHFTHYTVAHAHLGVYGFVAFVMFGSIYFVMPRILNWEWPYPKLISLHFWLAFIGLGIYVVPLSIGGFIQGLYMLDENKPFMDSVTLTVPYLWARSVGGGLMTLAHFVFAFHFFAAVLRHGPKRSVAAFFSSKSAPA
jgi:cytochrome c oxidase cbb3-type subunit I